MYVKLTVTDETGRIATIRVPPSTLVRNLPSQIESSLSIPAASQELRFNGTPLSPSHTVATSGLSDGDLILVLRKPSSSNSDILNSIRTNPSLMERLRQSQPQLYASVQAGDPTALDSVLQQMRQWQQGMGLPDLMPSSSRPRPSNASPAGDQFVDPMSAEAQKAIEERIRQENIMENMEAAIEHNPEAFGSVVMLFVDCKINSVNVKAFVDSGAQATIISKQCAERCNILRLLDTRFAGVAHGVGTARIFGRIHFTLMKLGSEFFEVSLTVMDAVGSGYDMLLGLDMLRKHQANIDLQNNCLRIGDSSVTFLAEKDIPRSMRSGGAGNENGGYSPSSSRATSVRGGSGKQASRNSGGGSSQQERALSRLVEMGFSRNEAKEALSAAGGDVDQAAAMLAAKKYGF